MPLVVALPYMIVEALAFWAVARWLGVGTALLLLITCFFLGLLLAAFEMRGIARKLSQGSENAGKAAGDIGLTAAGALAVAMPGFVTTILGLLLILRPTRALVRKSLAKKLRAKIEDLGVRSFEATNAYRQQASYGSFAGTVIDAEPQQRANGAQFEEELKRFSRDVRPEDFGTSGDR
ncbi:FxsA family protein [Corynebacterium gerontici]|uniref:Phage T7 F exclusion suppressor FxsA n=1 Tax=Corynebacterium gerontici TaxID=2079234 RepID=A0A3G6J048_9CORY|nr:FxsA family protein [Corynebacterium gerontici]AZA11405.1 phage T7 F exclusion suppressor FxsA [Corynebacterium gerontici]